MDRTPYSQRNMTWIVSPHLQKETRMFSPRDSDPMTALQPHSAWCGKCFATGSELASHEEHCPACDAIGMAMVNDDEPSDNFCPRCGKDIYDFSDYGCGVCDARTPEFGME